MTAISNSTQEYNITNELSFDDSASDLSQNLELSSEGSSPRSFLSSLSDSSRPETPPYIPPVFTITSGPFFSDYKVIDAVMPLRDATLGEISETTTRDKAIKQMTRDFAGNRSVRINDKLFSVTLQRLDGLTEEDWEDQKSLAMEVQTELTLDYLQTTIAGNCTPSNKPELKLLINKTLLAATQIGAHSSAMQSFQFVKSKIPNICLISNISQQSVAKIEIGKNQIVVTESQKLHAKDENGKAIRMLELEHTCDIISGTMSIKAKVHKV